MTSARVKERALVAQEQHAGLFAGADVVLVDEDPLWLAWQTAQESWEKRIRDRGSENTLKAYKTAVRQFFAWARVAPWQVSQMAAEEWVNHLRESGRAKATVNQRLAGLASLYDYVQRRYVARASDGREVRLWPVDRVNPFQSVDRYRESAFGRAKFPSDEELQALINAINQKTARGKFQFALLYTYAVTCQRDEAIRELKWGDIQARGDGVYTFWYHYKGDDEDERRLAKLPAFCYQAIVAYLKAVERWPLEDNEYVFVALDPGRVRRLRPDAVVNENAPVDNSTVNRMLKSLARRAGVGREKAHIHGLRHAGARLRWKLQKEQGTQDVLEMMTILGHKQVSTSQIYIQQILDDPEDPSGDLAAMALAPRPKRRRDNKPLPDEQLGLEL